MAKIYMIRHGRAAAGWDADRDPGLDALGGEQAEAVARMIARRVGGAVPVLSSPLRRCRETAVPLARHWRVDPVIEPRVAEIPSPLEDLEARTVWLRTLMAGTWDAPPPGSEGVDLAAWRRGVVDALLALEQDTVVFSHFIAINVAAGHAIGDPRVVCFRPDNCSVTLFETGGGGLRLIEQGRNADTKVN